MNREQMIAWLTLEGYMPLHSGAHRWYGETVSEWWGICNGHDMFRYNSRISPFKYFRLITVPPIVRRYEAGWDLIPTDSIRVAVQALQEKMA